MKIVLSITVTLLLLGCSDSSKSNHAKNEINKQIQETVNVVSQSSQKVMAKAEEATKVIVKQAKEVSKETVKEVKEKTAKVVESVAHKTAKIAKNVEKQAKAKAETEPAVDGAKLFTACVGCHGSHGERKALGKSAIIRGWQTSKTEAALQGYKDGTYGSSMKGVMKSQISKFNDVEIKALAKHIATL